jgi:hypothetical protein
VLGAAIAAVPLASAATRLGRRRAPTAGYLVTAIFPVEDATAEASVTA